jgi:hypothetical protein
MSTVWFVFGWQDPAGTRQQPPQVEKSNSVLQLQAAEAESALRRGRWVRVEGP